MHPLSALSALSALSTLSRLVEATDFGEATDIACSIFGLGSFDVSVTLPFLSLSALAFPFFTCPSFDLADLAFGFSQEEKSSVKGSATKTSNPRCQPAAHVSTPCPPLPPPGPHLEAACSRNFWPSHIRGRDREHCNMIS